MNTSRTSGPLYLALLLAVGSAASPIPAAADAGAPAPAASAEGSGTDPWYGEDKNYGGRGHSIYAKPAHDADYMVADGLIARPLGIASTIIGTALFVVTLPFSYIGGNVDEAGQVLVQEPANYTFGRCLGCF